jgi:gliding motility-associated transport system ATP-binding protein
VLVQCRGPAKEVENALMQVSGVGAVEKFNGESMADNGYVSFAIRAKDQRDVREEVAGTIIRNGWPLREIRVEHGSLEELFVRVTAGQARSKAVAS